MRPVPGGSERAGRGALAAAAGLRSPAQAEAGGADMRAQGPFAAQRWPASRDAGESAQHAPPANGRRERAPENACRRHLPFGTQRSCAIFTVFARGPALLPRVAP